MSLQKTHMLSPSENSGEVKSPIQNPNPVKKMGEREDGPGTWLKLPTQAYLKSRFDYNPENGELRWKLLGGPPFERNPQVEVFNSSYVGKIAGSKKPNCYSGLPESITVSMELEGKRYVYKASRLIMTLMGHEIPPHAVVDHINGNPFDNRYSNLRITSIERNGFNKTRWKTGKYNLPKGVKKNNKRFLARISHKGKLLTIGNFPTAWEAGEAWEKKAKELRGEFHANRSKEEMSARLNASFEPIPA